MNSEVYIFIIVLVLTAGIFFVFPQIFVFFILIIFFGLIFLFTGSFLAHCKVKIENPSKDNNDSNDTNIPQYPSIFNWNSSKNMKIEPIDKNPFFRYKLYFTLKLCVIVLIPSLLILAFLAGFFSPVFSVLYPKKEEIMDNTSMDHDLDGLTDSEENILNTNIHKVYSFGKIDDANRELVYCPEFVNCNNDTRDAEFLVNLTNVTPNGFDWVGYEESNWSSCEICSTYPGLYGIWMRDPIVQIYSQKVSFENETINETIDNSTIQVNQTYFYVNGTKLGPNPIQGYYHQNYMSPVYYLTHNREGSRLDSSNTGYVLLRDADFNATLYTALINETKPVSWVEFNKNGTESVLLSSLVLTKDDYYSTFSYQNISTKSIQVMDSYNG